MSQDQWSSVERYIVDAVVGADPVLEAAIADSAAAGLPPIAVSPNEGKFLHLLARAIGAQRILEIGTLGGYSAIWLGRALSSDGTLITLEAVEKHAEVARKNIARAGLADRVDLRLGRALETLPKILAAREGPFDLIFIDADKPAICDYFEWSLKLARPGTMIVVDNVVRTGKIVDANSADASVQGVRRFYQMLASEKRASATAIQTVGSKGYDGFSIAIVNG